MFKRSLVLAVVAAISVLAASHASAVVAQGGQGFATTTKVTVAPKSPHAGEQVEFSIEVSFKNGGDPVDSGTIALSDADGPLAGCTQITLSSQDNGAAGCEPEDGFAAGQVTVTANYTSDFEFKPSKDTITFTVQPPKGTAGDDVIEGAEGDERLNGGAGDDTLKGGPGDDRLVGGSGEDKLRGGPGDDKLIGGGDADQLRCGAGDDTVADVEPGESVAASCERVRMSSARGGAGTVTKLTASPQNGRAYSNLTLTATVTDAATGDPVDTGEVEFIDVEDRELVCNVDVSSSGEAECPYRFLPIKSLFLASYSGPAGESDDEYTIPAGTSATSAGDDTVNGSDDDDPIRGRGGDDTLRGRGGDDELRGGAGDDELRGGPDDDLLVGGAGADELRCGAGDDTVTKVEATDAVADSCESVS